MLGLVGGCLRGIVALVLVAALAVVAFLNRDRLMDMWQDVRGVAVTAPEEPSPELAERALRKLDALGDGSAQTATLTEVELQSLLQYQYTGLLPGFIDSVRVELEDDRIRVTGRVPIDRLPDVEGLSQAAALLPDTTDLTVTGQLLPLTGGRVALAVDEVSVSRIPLPDRLVSTALRRLGRRDEAGLPADAIALPLPAGAINAYVRGDSLVVVGSNGNGGR
ncbi:MAG: hypothetical protein ACREKM_12490 [Longimicrobiales bacterium]